MPFEESTAWIATTCSWATERLPRLPSEPHRAEPRYESSGTRTLIATMRRSTGSKPFKTSPIPPRPMTSRI